MEKPYALVPIDFNPFDGPEIEKVVPTSESQKEIWLSCILGGEKSSLAYNLSFSLLLEGESFDPDAFIKALYSVVSRHEALRASFGKEGDYLIIAKELAFNTMQADLSGLSDPVRQQQVNNRLQQEMSVPFDLVSGPLFKFYLYKLSNTAQLFTLIVHHAIADGWSIGVILEDIGTHYSAYSKKQQPSLPEASQISDYNRAEIRFKNSRDYQNTEAYWLTMYHSSVPVMDVPTDNPRPSPRSYEGRRYDFKIGREQVSQIKEAGARYGATLVITLLSAFEILLHKKTRSDEIIVGLPTAGQAATDNLNLVGHCVNLLPLRSNINDHLTFREYIQLRKDAFFDAYEHQRMTFGEFVKKLRIKRDDSRIPLSPIMFNVDMGMDTDLFFEGLSTTLISNPRAYETFEIFLNVNSYKGELALEWSYNTNLFKEETIASMAEEFYTLLTELISNPETTIKDLSNKADEKSLQIIDRINNTSILYPDHTNLAALISETCEQYPNKTALTFRQESLSFDELNRQSNQFAHYLAGSGITSGDIIGVALNRSPELLVSLLGVMKAGATYIPLDPEYPKDRIEFMLEDASAKALITSAGYKGHFKSDAYEIITDECRHLLSGFPENNIQCAATGNDIAYVLYTSGSTGKPKGVRIAHHSLVNFLLSMQKQPGISSADRLLAITTVSFDIAGLELFLPLLSGAELVIADAETARDGRLLPEMIRDKKISVMQATPSTWRMMLETGWEGDKNLKILCGGEAFPKDLAGKLLPVCKEVWNMYGPTETTIWSTIKRITDPENITIGHPIDNTKVYILNEHHELVSAMTEGEIYIGGEGVAAGYLNRPELTNERFIPNPFTHLPGDRIYQTGDMGMFSKDGELICLGRIDNQVKIRGFRIELGEIEHTLAKQEGIKQAVVAAVEIAPGNTQLVAYIIPERIHDDPREGGLLNANKREIEKWKTGILQSLPPYMVPQLYILLDRFPLTPNNKIDRKALPRPERVATQTDEDTKPLSEAPATPNEKLVAQLWSEALSIPQVNGDDDFFDLGGHSLIAVQVMNRLEKVTGKRLPLTTLFKHSTLREFAKLIDTGGENLAWDSLVAIQPSGSKPPLYIVHGFGLNVLVFKPLATSLDNDQPVYGLQAKGLDGRGNTITEISIEEIAAHYVQEIIRHNPDGPYVLSGYSAGGIIAFEMAKQFRQMNKEVAFLALFDTYTNMEDFKIPHAKKGITGYIAYAFNHLAYASRILIRHPKLYITKKTNFILGTLYNIYAKIKGKPKVAADDPDFSLKKLQWAYDKASKEYTFTPYDGHAYLFKSNDIGTTYFKNMDTNGWGPYFLKGMTVIDTPFGHLDFFEKESVPVLAEHLQAALKTAALR